MGHLIMEPNVKRSGIRRRCPEMKRVSRRSGFALKCHAQTIQEREREVLCLIMYFVFALSIAFHADSIYFMVLQD